MCHSKLVALAIMETTCPAGDMKSLCRVMLVIDSNKKRQPTDNAVLAQTYQQWPGPSLQVASLYLHSRANPVGEYKQYSHPGFQTPSSRVVSSQHYQDSPAEEMEPQ